MHPHFSQHMVGYLRYDLRFLRAHLKMYNLRRLNLQVLGRLRHHYFLLCVGILYLVVGESFLLVVWVITSRVAYLRSGDARRTHLPAIRSPQLHLRKQTEIQWGETRLSQLMRRVHGTVCRGHEYRGVGLPRGPRIPLWLLGELV